MKQQLLKHCLRMPGYILLLASMLACSGNPGKPVNMTSTPPVLIDAPDPGLDSLRTYIKGFADREETPGIELLLAKKGKIIFWEAYGFADTDFKKPFLKDTIVFLASSTKPITTTAIMTLVDEGRLSLDAPVSTYLPGFDQLRTEDGQPAPCPTIRQLLSHTSGWAGLQEMSPDATMAIRDNELTLKESVEKISREPLLAEPGTRFSYGGLSFNVAGRVAEVVSGTTFDVLIQEKVFTPLKMVDTTFRPTALQGERIAGIFKPAPWGGQLNLLRFNPEREQKLLMIGGGLYSTARDLATFLQMHLNRGQYGSVRILSEKAVAEMQKHQIGNAELGFIPLETLTSYGLGWIRDSGVDEQTAHRVSHAGAFGSVAWIDRERDLIGVLFTPMPLKDAYPIHKKIQARIRNLIPSGE
ncbi:MAG: beta-lactamase family protein [Deltaproteobacteria bacterium]|nr:beta-lactamase family protein [Deltaproteobacteria bacterium]MBT4644117.1 beta-lactamase family protein [Deltaproteobacteria bacterium]MBT6503631.1 beta-lactamase family protein [Deltaproteobacteria bacterium]